MRKKILSALLCAVMVMSLLAGCGSKDNTTSNNNSESAANKGTEVSSEAAIVTESQEAVEAAYPLVQEPITFTGLVWDASGNNMESRVLWDKISEITGVNFEWIVIDKEIMSTYLAAGNWEFDFIHNPMDASYILDYGVDSGMLADYNDYLEYMPNLQQLFADYPESRNAITESNGAIYGLPTVSEVVTSTQARTYYRTDLLEEVGITSITSVDDFYNALKAMKDKTGKAAFIPWRLNEDASFQTCLYTAFGTAETANFDSDGNGNVIYNRTSEQYKHYLEFMNKLYADGLIDPEFLTATKDYALAATQAGETVFLNDEAQLLTEADFANGEIQLSCLPPLTSEYDTTQTYLAQLPTRLGGFYLNAKSDNLEILCQVLDIAYATEEIVEGSGITGDSFTYGFIGENLIFNEDGTYEQKLPDGYEGTFTTYQYEELLWSNAGRATALASYITSTPGNAQARQIGFRDYVLPYACDYSEVFPSSYLKLTSDENAAISGKLADVNAYVEEMRAKFITGVEDIGTAWDSYVEGLYKRGLQDVIDVYQAAYDRWNNQ